MKKDIKEFLRQSNWIEQEYGLIALEDACKAWEYAIKQKYMGLPEILEIHRLLMKRLNPRIAGKIRDCNVTVGGRYCPVPQSLPGLLEEFINDFNAKYSRPMSVKKELDKIMHIKFEGIHPFEDGNGRTGRILWQWHRLKLKMPVQIIHEGEEQYEYYKWFKGV